jgi:hypothetical protein
VGCASFFCWLLLLGGRLKEILCVFLVCMYEYLVVLLCNLRGWVTDGSQHPGEGPRAASFFFAHRVTMACTHTLQRLRETIAVTSSFGLFAVHYLLSLDGTDFDPQPRSLIPQMSM